MARSNWQNEALVGDFLSLKRRVLDACGNDPSSIESMANGDEPFRQLCLQLSSATYRLRLSEESATGGIIAPVNQSFIQEWRDYEKRLSAPLAGVFLADLGMSLGEGEKATQEEISDDCAKQEANDLTSLIQYLEDRANDTDDERFQTFLGEGLAAWRNLTTKVGLDLRGVFRRVQLAPLVLMPNHVARKYGPNEGQSLYLKWTDARRAFVFGALHASIAMSRATLEQILKDGYGLNTTNLHKAIKKLGEVTSPAVATKADRLRVVAKFLLHAEYDSYKRTELEILRERKIRDEALSNLEREVAALLLVLRDLIEGAHDDVELVVSKLKLENECSKEEN